MARSSHSSRRQREQQQQEEVVVKWMKQRHWRRHAEQLQGSIQWQQVRGWKVLMSTSYIDTAQMRTVDLQCIRSVPACACGDLLSFRSPVFLMSSQKKINACLLICFHAWGDG